MPLPEERDEGGVGSRSGEPSRRQWPGRVPLGAPAPQRGKESFLTPERTGSFQTTAGLTQRLLRRWGPWVQRGKDSLSHGECMRRGQGEPRFPAKPGGGPSDLGLQFLSLDVGPPQHRVRPEASPDPRLS